jgi:prephenate dehydratase
MNNLIKRASTEDSIKSQTQKLSANTAMIALKRHGQMFTSIESLKKLAQNSKRNSTRFIERKGSEVKSWEIAA